MAPTTEELDFLINHVVFPLKTPQTDDKDVGEAFLREFTARIAQDFAGQLSANDQSTWENIANAMSRSAKLHEEDRIRETLLRNAIRLMRPEEALYLHVQAQNAALVLLCIDSGIEILCFEVAACREAVMSAKAALIRRFPARAVHVPRSLIENDKFCTELARLIHNQSVEQLDQSQETSSKAGNTVTEPRESRNPRLVCELLMAILASHGSPSEVKTILKRTQDQIAYEAGALSWRRSPLWLSIRASLQLTNINSPLADTEQVFYKNYMIFMISKLGELALENGRTTQDLHTINVKLTRRCAKLKDATFDFVRIKATATVDALDLQLERRWSVAQTVETFAISLENIRNPPERGLSLQACAPVLLEILERARNPVQADSVCFEPKWQARGNFKDYALPSVEARNTSSDENILLLRDFETWVSKSLRTWTAQGTRTGADCMAIKCLISAYLSLAKAKYEGNSEQNSIMLLTVAEMWMAVEIIALRNIPLLTEYAPEIPCHFFQSLMLPHLEHLARLERLEQYLEKRHSKAHHFLPSIYDNTCHRSLAIRYWDQSSDLKSLQSKIEKEAYNERNLKREEWLQKDKFYREKMAEAAAQECTFLTDYRGRKDHASSCNKCSCEAEAGRVRIDVHEWPLPASEIACKAAVFELGCPEAFAALREATWILVQDLGRMQVKRGPGPEQRLCDYEALLPYATKRSNRIGLASTTKSWTKTHFQGKRFPVSIKEILLNNGLQWRTFDKFKNLWVLEQKIEPEIQQFCITKLPRSSYSKLQFAVDVASHNDKSQSQNIIIAKQGDCPKELSQHDWQAFGSLRNGVRLQWPNITRELASKNLDFNSPATRVLFTQAAYQAGPRSLGTLREAHAVFLNPDFCVCLYDTLEELFKKISANWKQINTMALLCMILRRLLALDLSCERSHKVILLLKEVRKVTLAWAKKILDLMRDKRDKDGIEKPKDRARALQAAIICRSTFLVDEQRLSQCMESVEDVSTYVQCSIIVHDSTFEVDDEVLNRDIFNDKKYVADVENRVQDLLENCGVGFSNGIGSIWGTLTLSGDWKVVSGPDRSWITNWTEGTPQAVHFNILTGALFVAGKPIGRLPDQFSESPIYKRAFGSCIFDVLLSDVPDMSYMTSKEVCGHVIYFGLFSGRVIIRTRLRDMRYELVPHSCFYEDLPRLIVEDTLQWMCLESGQIEFRKIKSQWELSESNWCLKFMRERPANSTMRQADTILLDRHSVHGEAFASIFGRFESVEYLHITVTDDGLVEVNLPRFHLQFFVNEKGQIQSRELAAIYDENQAIGTLHGLRSHIVLKGPDEYSGKLQRIVLIPYGDVRVGFDNNTAHANVEIDDRKTRTRQFFQYAVSKPLRCLHSGSDLLAYLFKAYLHAVTSFVLPDRFLGRTGTSEALSSLSQSMVYTSMPFSPDVSRTLDFINKLSPARSYYPAHLKLMESVGWRSDLPSYVQHESFHTLVKAIIEHNQNSFWMFSEETTESECQQTGLGVDPHLEHRAMHRRFKIDPTSFEEINPAVVVDQTYDSRDRNSSKEEKAVYEISSYIKEWSDQLPIDPKLEETVANFSTVSGFGNAPNLTSLYSLLFNSLSEYFGMLHDLCRKCTREEDTARMTFIFAPIVFGNPELLLLLTSLLAIATNSSVRHVPMPTCQSEYWLHRGSAPNGREISRAIEGNIHHFCGVTDPAVSSEARSDIWQEYEREKMQQEKLIIEHIRRSWPLPQLSLPTQSQVPHVDVVGLKTSLSSIYADWYQNYRFLQYLNALQKQLRIIHCKPLHRSLPDLLASYTGPVNQGSRYGHAVLSENWWLQSDFPPPKDHERWRLKSEQILNALEKTIVFKSTTAIAADSNLERRCEELRTIIEEFSSSAEPTRNKYAAELGKSLASLKKLKVINSSPSTQFSLSKLEVCREALDEHLDAIFTIFSNAISPRNGFDKYLDRSSFWTRITPRKLMRLLSLRNRQELPSNWREAITSYAVEITTLQRIERIMLLLESGNNFTLEKEIQNKGHDCWQPSEYPDWLLLEVENNLLIRPQQVKVAREMINPSNASNAAQVLNMGEGKSTVIMPMVMSELANGANLARAIVLKPLLKQMHYILSQRLGGMIGRKVTHLPFLRKTQINHERVRKLLATFQAHKRDRDVILALPEHILSLQLVSINQLDSEDEQLAKQLQELQQWLRESSRDVLDECDEILSPNYELVHTLGLQNRMDGAPDRWILTEALLGLVQKHSVIVKNSMPEAIELQQTGSGIFPRIRVLNDAAADQILSLISQDIGNGLVQGISIIHLSSKDKDATLRFIGKRNISKEDFDSFVDYFQNSAQLLKFFLLRGLIAHRIILYGLQQKRWLANYGLDRITNRTLAAVPYQAKGVPSTNSEFSHSDVAISLTCISYYYTGLLPEQMRMCLSSLMRMADPTEEYSKWVVNSSLPATLHDINGVNEDDEGCLREIYNHLRESKAVIDYFLNEHVFPKEGKEFPRKLSTSAWDIPLTAPWGSVKTTGFSGTDDLKDLLPLSISQQNLKELQHTSALVLTNLLRKENRKLILAANTGGSRLSSEAFLSVVISQNPPISVLIDVGAQLLDLSNLGVAKKWLAMSKSKKAAVFFDEQDEAIVIDSEGNQECLTASRFRDNLVDCLVFIDEFRSRGLDLILPDNTQALVTLGPKLIKDRFIQACMRMRKLGHSHSIMTAAPPEVHRDILKTRNSPVNTPIDIADVLRWTIEQTCLAVINNLPLWATRGLNHSRRRLAGDVFLKHDSKPADKQSYLEKMSERESWPLAEMYDPTAILKRKQLPLELLKGHQEDSIIAQLTSIWKNLDVIALQDGELQEEQEREVSLEIEAEKAVERPPTVEPEKPKISKGLEDLIKTGIFEDDVFLHAFSTLQCTSAGKQLEYQAWQVGLFVTSDFNKTVVVAQNSKVDDYLRFANWVISCKTGQLLIISPHEANTMLPQIIHHKAVTLHCYAARISKAMRSFDNLDFLNFGKCCDSAGPTSRLQFALNIFAGQLYVTDLESYMSLCKFLGVLHPYKKLRSAKRDVSCDGFVSKPCREFNNWSSDFEKSPLLFLKELLTIRRKGCDFLKSHIGRVANGWILEDSDFS